MMNLHSLEELYEKALNDIKGEKGVITINIAGIPKTSNSNDIIGNCVQEWIPQWLEDNGLKMEANDRSQVFPDFSAEIDGKIIDMEVKSWNYGNSPAFDISNFDGFYREIYSHPKKLYAKYLIFGYTPIKHGFRLDDIFLKNIWEITGKARSYPIGLQVKQGHPYAIRPFAFHKYPNRAFSSLEGFVRAVYETRKLFPFEEMINPEIWLQTVLKAVDDLC